MLIDAAAATSRFDLGDRVVVPALLARGISRLDSFVLTHADLDHAGGSLAILADLRPAIVVEGIAPARSRERALLIDGAMERGVRVDAVRAGGSTLVDGVLLRVLHPPPPEWERQDVRNDDSVVIELIFGGVSMVLMGDAGEAVEAAIAGELAPAALRVLKAGHHGSRTSTSQVLLDAARPVAALVSAGRGNMYGHPSAEVVARLERAGAAIFRTDRDGEIDVLTDGRTVDIRTWSGRRWQVSGGGAAARRFAGRSSE
jgi:competence protein ComEC